MRASDVVPEEEGQVRDPNYSPQVVSRPSGEPAVLILRGAVAAAMFLLVLTACSHTHADLSRPQTQDSFGVQMAKMNLWREAMFRFQRAVDLNPANALAHNNLAVAYEANGEFDKAAKEYREALRLDRSNQYIQKNYSRYTEFMARNKKRQQRQEAKEVAKPETGAAPAAASASTTSTSAAPIPATSAQTPAATPAAPASTAAAPNPAGAVPATTSDAPPATTAPAKSSTAPPPQTPPAQPPPAQTPPPPNQPPQNPPANPPGEHR